MDYYDLCGKRYVKKIVSACEQEMRSLLLNLKQCAVNFSDATVNSNLLFIIAGIILYGVKRQAILSPLGLGSLEFRLPNGKSYSKEENSMPQIPAGN